MTKSTSRQKTNNANTSAGKNATTAPTTPANLASTKITNKNTNVTQHANKNTGKMFALTEVTTASVQQARQIRKTDFERFQKFHNFFMANEEPTARVINDKANAKREIVDKWIGGAVSPKTLACIQEIQETQSGLLELLIVSAALTKYGEKELARRDSLGEMDYVVGARFGTNGLRSKQHAPHSVGLNFVLRLVLGLAPEKRSSCEVLREILGHESNGRLALIPTESGLQPYSDATASYSDDWAELKPDQLRQMASQTQSDKFQDTMQQLSGEHLYDAIRTQLKQTGGASVWDATKDKSALKVKNIRPRMGSADKNAKSKKEADRQQKQPVKINEASQVKKHLPVEVEKVTLVPPPAPVIMKSTTDAATKKEGGKKKGKKGKKADAEKNVAPVKDATAVKNIATTSQKAGAIKSSARDGRAVVSKAL
ncbi:hypothetical protein GN958_ATG18920 [Phytophthora infestans]|uniref:Uncharacterized protein n=1 Tax=Phytophthora infestans TaxID=4787 RepID=A0A8S9TXY2_PHYIN|nr:hypothetical protein GN958_ATG18920 [Phytophthora infestans]